LPDDPAGADVERDHVAAQRLANLLDGAFHRRRVGRVVVTNVRRRRDNTDPVCDGRPSDLQAAGQRLRAVVDAREDVRVEVDHGRRYIRSG